MRSEKIISSVVLFKNCETLDCDFRNDILYIQRVTELVTKDIVIYCLKEETKIELHLPYYTVWIVELAISELFQASIKISISIPMLYFLMMNGLRKG